MSGNWIIISSNYCGPGDNLNLFGDGIPAGKFREKEESIKDFLPGLLLGNIFYWETFVPYPWLPCPAKRNYSIINWEVKG